MMVLTKDKNGTINGMSWPTKEEVSKQYGHATVAGIINNPNFISLEIVTSEGSVFIGGHDNSSMTKTVVDIIL